MAANAAAPDKQPPVLPSVEASQKCGAIDRTGCVAAGHIDEADCAAPIQPAHQRNLTPAEWTRAVVLDGQFSHVSAPEIVCHSASNSLAGGRNAAKWPLPPHATASALSAAADRCNGSQPEVPAQQGIGRHAAKANGRLVYLAHMQKQKS
jgi:hypothetical protein